MSNNRVCFLPSGSQWRIRELEEKNVELEETNEEFKEKIKDLANKLNKSADKLTGTLIRVIIYFGTYFQGNRPI